MLEQIGGFAVFIGLCFVTGLSGAIFKPGDWYKTLDKPAWTPPDWAFGVVWSILYVMIAISGWLVWRASGVDGAATAFVVFAIQLVLNFAWSAIFFGLKRPDWAIAETALLWLSILATAILFHAHSPLAAWMLIPYLAWVGVAFALNLSILRRNPVRQIA